MFRAHSSLKAKRCNALKRQCCCKTMATRIEGNRTMQPLCDGRYRKNGYVSTTVAGMILTSLGDL